MKGDLKRLNLHEICIYSHSFQGEISAKSILCHLLHSFFVIDPKMLLGIS